MSHEHEPTHHSPPTFGQWLAENSMPLLFVVAIAGLIFWRGLSVVDFGLAALGLGFVIFLHELGHFLAAKFCDVHVETFSIGFGKAIPGCQFKRGETTYKIGWIPLGGYVKMVGEGDNADTEEADEDPRSFKNKSVFQRMLIISAGVIMNVILGITCLVVAYSNGVQEAPGIIGYVGAGTPAWQAGIRDDSQILQIGGIEQPTYPDIRTKVMGSSKGEPIPLRIQLRDGTIQDIELIARRDEGELFPTVGLGQTHQLTLAKSVRHPNFKPVLIGSAADSAKDASGNGFQQGDRIIATSDPANPNQLKDLPPDPRDPSKLDYFAFNERLYLFRGKPIVVQVQRGDQKIDLTVPPEYTKVIPGIRLQMGRITAIRQNSPGSLAKPLDTGIEHGLQAVNNTVPDSGDRIIEIEVRDAEGKLIRYVDTPSAQKAPDVEEIALDAAKLPFWLSEWADKTSSKRGKVKVTVMRAEPSQKSPRRLSFELDWDDSFRFSNDSSVSPNSPLAISGLGLAYSISNVIDSVTPDSPAALAGMKKSDVIHSVRIPTRNLKGETKEGDWVPLKSHQGASLIASLQNIEASKLELKLNSEDSTPISIEIAPDKSWPTVERGFIFENDTRLQKADGLAQAFQFGFQRTVRMVRSIYQQLYALVSGRISAKTMSGPLSIADISYKIVGQDIWAFIVFIGMISLNLAVVNFLPIPVLDGGHMVFLIYEKIRGKPAPDKVIEWSLYGGLGLILSLMMFVLYQDVRRLFL